MQHLGSINVMRRYEPGFDRFARATAVVSQIPKRTSGTEQEATFHEGILQDEGLPNKILASLPAPEFKRLLPFLEPVALSTGEDLNRNRVNEYNDFVYFPESAVVSNLYLLKSGGETAAALIGYDGVVGLSAVFESRPAIYCTRVTIGGEGLRVKTQIIKQEFARGECLQRLILNYMSKRLAQLSQRAVCNGRHKLADRLCTWLLMIDDRTVDGTLPLTHADIANQLGAQRAVITACCRALRTRAMISYTRGRIINLDRKELEAAACECYQVLKQ
jgi:CRP-like cAMP-binding protein